MTFLQATFFWGDTGREAALATGRPVVGIEVPSDAREGLVGWINVVTPGGIVLPEEVEDRAQQPSDICAAAVAYRLGPLWDIPTIHEWREMAMGQRVDETTAWVNQWEVQSVAQKVPTVVGLFDVHGNVWQLCHGFTADKPRLCGGSVRQTAIQCRHEERVGTTNLRDPYTGFRLVYRGDTFGE